MNNFFSILFSILLSAALLFTMSCKKPEKPAEEKAPAGETVAPVPKPIKGGAIALPFQDDFDGKALKDYWEVINPGAGKYTVENGGLLVVSSSPAKLSDKNIENLFRLTTPLPEGDWVMTAKMSTEYQTGYERSFIGIYENPDNFIAVSTDCHGLTNTGEAQGHIVALKNSSGSIKSFQKRFWSGKYRSDQDGSENLKALPQPLLLRIRKVGRFYIPGVMLEKAEKPEWVETEKFTMITLKGSPVIGIYQDYEVKGETPVTFNWVKIEKTE